MSIDDCVVVGIEGSHGTGKTTLAHSLTAALSAEGVQVGCLGEVVRGSPWFQEALLRGDGRVSSDAFLHLVANQLRLEIEGTQYNRVLVCDRTILSTLGYWELRLNPRHGDERLLEVLQGLAGWHTARYDMLLYCEDYYDLTLGEDPFRGRDAAFREASDESIRSTIERFGTPLEAVPRGLDPQTKTAWARKELLPFIPAPVPR